MIIVSQFAMNANNSKKYSCEKRKVYRYFLSSFIFIFSRILLRIFFHPLLLFLEFARNVKQLIKHDDILKHLISDNRLSRLRLQLDILYVYFVLFYFSRSPFRKSWTLAKEYDRMAERQNEDKKKLKFHKFKLFLNTLSSRH